MTRKHFVLIAEHLKASRPDTSKTDEYTTGCRDQWNYTVGFVANACQKANFAFDRVRFVTACGGLF